MTPTKAKAEEKKDAPKAKADPVIADTHHGYGSIQIHNNVIAVITRMAALKVPGVVELGGSIVDGLADMITKGSRDKGIKIAVEETGVSIDLHIVVEYGRRIPQVAGQVQEDVKAAVEQMTGKQVKTLNVTIQGVKMAGAPNKDTGKAES